MNILQTARVSTLRRTAVTTGRVCVMERCLIDAELNLCVRSVLGIDCEAPARICCVAPQPRAPADTVAGEQKQEYSNYIQDLVQRQKMKTRIGLFGIC